MTLPPAWRCPTQSGGIGLAVSESLQGIGLGVSTFASVGNKSDVSDNDMLLWWRHDDRTKVAIVYLESFGNPRKFARLARQLTRRVPLVVVRAGASEVAQRAARSHTAATATPAVIRDELFRPRAGIRRRGSRVAPTRFIDPYLRQLG